MSKKIRGNSAKMTEELRPNRRQLLKNAGSMAAYVAPAMTVLISGDSANAHHRDWHLANCKNFPQSAFCASVV